MENTESSTVETDETPVWRPKVVTEVFYEDGVLVGKVEDAPTS